ncbi:sugar kinase [Streptomyces sp. NPDC047081]|uniref:sugar kinase n=1 Tax=Streptomyces sp. NPDC047081 TaxID=3154706 RepID=UPI003410E3DC
MRGADPEAPVEVVCVGETMAVLAPADTAHPLALQTTLALSVGGAESNVACALVALGRSAAWLGRVGADPLGRRVLADLADRGVDVSAAQTDPTRPTGVYFKDPGPDGTGVHYYRRGSAASAMGPELAAVPLLHRARVLHLSGITAALSGTCAELLTNLVVRRTVPGPLVSFDVNHRPSLWRDRPRDAAPALLRLARSADLVFVGRDEAETLWGTRTPAAVHDLLGPGRTLVVKDAGHGATAYGADGTEAFVPAPPARIVERVGAGDAFAAGFLAALLEGRAPEAGLRLGHLAAAAALATTEDIAPLCQTPPVPSDHGSTVGEPHG